MAQWLFCSRFWCPIEEDENGYEMIKAHSEIIVGEEGK